MKDRIAALCILAYAAATAAEPAPPLEPVTVTALREGRPLAGFAGSATRLSAAEVSLTGATHHAELLNRVPGVMIQRGSGQESLTALRSPVLTGPGSCGAFLFLEDGIPLRPVGFCNVNELFEVNAEQADAVEVLRGPGSALYGSNAVHGIVNVFNPAPADLPRLALAAEAGPDEYLRGKLRASGRWGPADTGIALHATHDGGWRDSSGFNEQKLASSAVSEALGGTLTLRLNATHLDQQTAGFIVGEDAFEDEHLAKSNPNPEAFRQAHSLRATAHLARTLSGGGLDLRIALRSSRMDFLQHFLLGQPLERSGQDSLAVLGSRSMATGPSSHLVFGLDAEIARGSLLQQQDGPTTGGPPPANAIRPAGRQYDYEVGSTWLAPYAQWEWQVADRLSVTAGLRFEWLRYDYDNRMLDGNTDENGLPCPGGCLYTRPADRADEFTNLGPRLGLTWRVTGKTSLWTAASQGYRPPEATELYRLQRGQQVADLDSERMDGIEAGLRHLAPALQLELTAFWMDKRNVILRDSLGYNVSGGSTRHRGLEYGIRLPLGPAGWNLEASGSWARHIYGFSGGIEQGEQVTRGDDIDTAPRHLHSARIAYAGRPVGGELEWAHVGGYWANASNTARYPGHDLFNLRLEAVLAPRWTLVARIINLADTAYADRADYAFGNYRYFPGRGRTAFIELGWRLD